MNRIVYLHGFASSPQSKKAQFFKERFARHGVALDIPDLSPDGLERLTISGQLAIVEQAARGEAVSLMGSSMGGYLAAVYASTHPEVYRVVMMAPAFDFARRWTARIGEEAATRWREAGFVEMPDYRTGAPARVGYSLIDDALPYPTFPAIEQPGLIFHGIRDEVVDYRSSVEYAAAHPNVRLQLFDAGHELTEVTDEIWRPLLRFFPFG